MAIDTRDHFRIVARYQSRDIADSFRARGQSLCESRLSASSAAEYQRQHRGVRASFQIAAHTSEERLEWMRISARPALVRSMAQTPEAGLLTRRSSRSG